MELMEISCEELSKALASGDLIRLVDCRETWEHELVKIEGSAHIPMNDTPERVDEYRAIKGPCVVYCHHGIRSMNVVGWLRQQGVENVRSLAGGIDAWSLSIDPELPRY